MSGPMPPAPGAPPQAANTAHSANLSREDREELSRLEGSIARIKKSVPTSPYVLSVPSKYSHVSKQESRTWMVGRWFASDEYKLQYRTFLMRDPIESGFHIEAGEDAPRKEPAKPRLVTVHQGPKKVISLGDYNKGKQVNGGLGPESKTSSPSLAPSKPADVNGSKKTVEPVPQPLRNEVLSHKRPAAESPVPDKPPKRAKEDPPTSQPPPILVPDSVGPDSVGPVPVVPDSVEPVPVVPDSVVPDSVVPDSVVPDSRVDTDTSTPSHRTPHGLLPILSPLDQALLVGPHDHGLPPILSPTLPQIIEVEVKRLEEKRQRGDSNASTSSSGKKNQSLTVPEQPPRKGEDDTHPSRVRSASVNEKASSNTSLNRESVSKPSLMVVLKYKKGDKERLKRYLKLPGKLHLAAERKSSQENSKEKNIAKSVSHPSETSTPIAKATGVNGKVAEKRPRTAEDTSSDRPPKRSRQDRPSTPPPPPVASSPALSNTSSAQKSQGPYVTPRKDHNKTISMVMNSSTEGNDATPGSSGVTPSNTKPAPTSAPLGANRLEESKSLSVTSQKFNVLGRTLKHHAQKLENEIGKPASENAMKMIAVTGLECILSYMVAYGVEDQAKTLRGRSNDVMASWMTLMPLCFSYIVRTKRFPHLEGLRLNLFIAILSTICTQIVSHIPRAKNPPESSQPDSQVPENSTLIAEPYTRLCISMSEVRTCLPIESLQKDYPKTWSGREVDGKLAKTSEKFNPSNLSGPYFLPIQSDTTPLQAVRFGLAFLSEYCEREKLDYTLRVNLEKPE